ncbi:fasciclin-like arabinogalactan protein 21 [Cynara cardunculus var. scolymus]|uniref:FAS1 domain-containing protein n=1 Tax=Cynara cardunculus var. scolymus TaxID=59895 RepID=A0A103XS93_CYNCS|nr:fasciclin-like arabinogalactan protein 21 [Cynara cardunculus var. scolymus]KVH95961.1 FAS1 domain-containing protein [Cynara cardunculus var. scolymus]
MSKAVLFITATILLAVVIAATFGSHHHHHQLPRHPKDSPFDFTSNASQLLRSNGFTFIATLLHISPDLFLSTPQSTIFAIPDSAMSNLSIPPYMTVQLVTYHISPSKLTIHDLFQKPVNTCISTMFQQQKISITKNDEKHRVLEINKVLITHPDMFVQGPVSIHGVGGPFASFKFHQEITELPICNTNQSELSHSTVGGKVNGIKKKAEWGMVVRFLSSAGFTPFALALYSVIDGILKDHPDLNSTTIFVPPIMEMVELPSSLRHKFMRSHIVPKKHSYKHLASLPEGTSLTTLCPGKKIEITETVVNLSDELLVINRVEVTSPDLLLSKSFVVHGIARPFAMEEASSISK